MGFAQNGHVPGELFYVNVNYKYTHGNPIASKKNWLHIILYTRTGGFFI